MLAVSCDHRRGRDTHSEHSKFNQLHIVKTGRIALFLAAGSAKVAIKGLL